MKAFFLVAFFSFLSITSIGQQSVVRGVISFHNSQFETGKRRYIQGVQVKDAYRKVQPDYSKADGSFELVYVEVPTGSRVNLSVEKAGSDLEVVDYKLLENVHTGNRERLSISMARRKDIVQFRSKFYLGIVSSQEKTLKAQIAIKDRELQDLRTQSGQDLEKMRNLEEQIGQLQDKLEELRVKAQDFSNFFYKINLDEADKDLRKAAILLQAGKIDSALHLLLEINLEDRVNELNENIRQLDSLKFYVNKQKDQLIDHLCLVADLFGIKNMTDSAVKYHRLKHFVEPENCRYVNDIAQAYFKADRKDSCIFYAKAAIALNQIKKDLDLFSYREQIRACLYLGYAFEDSDLSEAKLYYREALKCFSDSKRDQDIGISYVESAEINLSKIYINQGKLDSAKLILDKAIARYDDTLTIFRKSPQTIAMLLDRAGDYFGRIKDSVNQAQFKERAIKIYADLYARDKESNVQVYASMIINQGYHYLHDTDTSIAKEYFGKAFLILSDVEFKGNEAVESMKASLLNTMATVIRKSNHELAMRYLNEAIGIYVRYGVDNYRKKIAACFLNCGIISYDIDDFPSARSFGLMAVDAYRILTNSDSSIAFYMGNAFQLVINSAKRISKSAPIGHYMDYVNWHDSLERGDNLYDISKFADILLEATGCFLDNKLYVLTSQYALKALKSEELLYKKFNWDNREGLAYLQYYLAVALDSLHNYEAALTAYDSCLSLLQKRAPISQYPLHILFSQTLLSGSLCLSKLGSLKDAIPVLNYNLEYIEYYNLTDSNADAIKINTLDNLAKIYSELGNEDSVLIIGQQAASQLEELTKTNKEYSEKYLLTCINLFFTSVYMGNYDLGRNYGDKAEHLLGHQKELIVKYFNELLLIRRKSPW